MNSLCDTDLKKYGKTFSLSKKAISLINHQKANWPLAAANYASLRQVQHRSFNFGHFRIDCQFNPGRIRSSAANTEAQAIQERPCFLCEVNRPSEQAGILFKNDYTILCNPFPIFPYHLTIPHHRHEPQILEGHIAVFLKLIHDLDEFVIFYNGAQCGASAPDHFHFQAGIKDILPIEEELENLMTDQASCISYNTEIKVNFVEDYLRRLVILKATEPGVIESLIFKTISTLRKPGQTSEPMINLIGWFKNNQWHIVIFPRAAQRPREYYADDFERILVSPAAVELGGLIILPREEDFYKITANDLESIYSQVTLQKNDFDELKQHLIQTL